MPIKRKRPLSRAVIISPDAIARWREIRPEGIELQGDCAILFDYALADALGICPLIWTLEAREAFDRLEAIMLGCSD